MTYAQMLVNLKGRCGLLNNSTYDSYLKTWLNDGQRNITTRFLWSFLLQSETVTTVASTDTYQLGAECLVYDVRDTTNVFRLRFLRDMEFDAAYTVQTEAGVPRFYRMFGQTKSSASAVALPNIQFYPIPGGAYSITVKSYKRLSDMSNDTDVSEIPATFHELLINYAANIFFSSRGDVRATEQFDQYENKLADMVSQLDAVPADEIDVVRSLEDASPSGMVRFPASFGVSDY